MSDKRENNPPGESLPEDLWALLPLCVGDDLEAEQRDACQRLLERSPSARAELARLEEARRAFLGADRALVEPPPEVWSSIRATLLAEGRLRNAGSGQEAARTTPRATARGTRNRRPQVLALASLVSIAAAALLVLLGPFDRGAPIEGSGPERAPVAGPSGVASESPGVAVEGGGLQRAGAGDRSLREEIEALRALRNATPVYYAIEQDENHVASDQQAPLRLRRISLR